MSKKLPWPVAKIREDGAPAVWLTFTNWLLIEQALIGKYLGEREDFGARRARQEARTRFGPEWKTCKHLAEWAFLDAWSPVFSLESAAMEMYRAGWNAHSRNQERGAGDHPSPEALVAKGDLAERRGFEREVRRLQEAASAASQMAKEAA